MLFRALVPMILLCGGARASGEPVENGYVDNCNYTDKSKFKCGDQCLYFNYKYWSHECFCGVTSPIFSPFDHSGESINVDQRCCLPSGEKCTKDIFRWGEFGVCNQGKTLSKSSHCDNTNTSLQCHNGYRESRFIGEKSHYTCPHTCVPWEEMCRGVSVCENDHEVCGPDLRCPPGATKHNIPFSHASVYHRSRFL